MNPSVIIIESPNVWSEAGKFEIVDGNLDVQAPTSYFSVARFYDANSTDRDKKFILKTKYPTKKNESKELVLSVLSQDELRLLSRPNIEKLKILFSIFSSLATDSYFQVRKDEFWENLRFPGKDLSRKLPYFLKEAETSAYGSIDSESMEILRDPNLLGRIDAEFNKRIVGEGDNRKAIFIIACGSRVVNAKAVSYGLRVDSASGAGKDAVVSQVLGILPQEIDKSDLCVLSRTGITPKALRYWKNKKNNPSWSWDGKILYLPDISQETLDSDVLKVMVTEGANSVSVKDQEALDVEVVGKPCLIFTTALTSHKCEMARRFPIISLDESQAQTAGIVKRILRSAETGENLEYDVKIRKALSMLKRVKVKVPYAQLLEKHIPTGHISMRTHAGRLIDYIKASCALHQYQRETDAEGFLLATGQDFNVARIAIIQTTSNPYMVSLTNTQKKIIAAAKVLGREFKVEEIVVLTQLSKEGVYKTFSGNSDFSSLFFTSRMEELEVGAWGRPGRLYTLKDLGFISFPTWEEINTLNTGNETNTNNTINTQNTENTQRPQNSNNEGAILQLEEKQGQQANSVLIPFTVFNLHSKEFSEEREIRDKILDLVRLNDLQGEETPLADSADAIKPTIKDMRLSIINESAREYERKVKNYLLAHGKITLAEAVIIGLPHNLLEADVLKVLRQMNLRLDSDGVYGLPGGSSL